MNGIHCQASPIITAMRAPQAVAAQAKSPSAEPLPERRERALGRVGEHAEGVGDADGRDHHRDEEHDPEEAGGRPASGRTGRRGRGRSGTGPRRRRRRRSGSRRASRAGRRRCAVEPNSSASATRPVAISERADHDAEPGAAAQRAETAGQSAASATSATSSHAIGESGASLPRRWNCCEPNSSFR